MSPSYAAAPRNVRLLYLHNFLNDFRFQAVFLAIYFDQILGSYTAAMSVLAVEPLAAAFMDVPTGMFSDRMGRKITLILASICHSFSIACYAVAHSMPMLLIGAVMYGTGRCLFSGNNDALMLESLKEKGLENDFAHYQGRAGGMFQLALGLSALMGGFLSVYGLRFVFALGVLPQLATVAVALFIREPHVHVARPEVGMRQLCDAMRHVWRNKSLRLLVVGQAISYGFGESTFWFMGTFVNTLWPSWALGIYRGINHAFGFAGYWFAGKILARFAPPRMLVVADVAGFLSSFVAVAMGNGLSPLLMASGAVFFGPYMVARDQLLQSHFTQHQRATLGSIASFSGSILYAFAAVGIGVVSDHYGLAAGVGCGLIVSLLALPFFMAFIRASGEAL